jgi:hypothetical protein
MQFNKLSFWNLLSNNGIENIAIPIIQRSYTQGGRSGDPKIEIKGERFLERLIEALKGNPVTLDFIYGSNVKNKVYPLDGQQRLTTLFLLHWYIAQKQKEEKFDNAVKNVLRKFSYETRQSSRYFCEHLCEYKVDDAKRKDRLSDTIKNQQWFMLSWENDPSICSMLSMLDKIDIALKALNDETMQRYWDILTKDIDNCPITFFYTSLQDLNLTDDLYIKMNARGLELTDFEKFKATFNQKIDDEKWDADKKTHTEKFGHKIDTDWADLFWPYRGEDDLIDNELVNFITGISINNYAINSEILPNEEEEDKIRTELTAKGKSKSISDDTVKQERIERRIAKLANNSNDICPNDFPTKNTYQYLVDCLNKYGENNNDKTKPSKKNLLWSYCDSTLFEDLITGKNTTFSRRVLFYAQTEYLLKHIFSPIQFDDWMRVVRNIIANSTIDSATTFISAINLIKELSNGSADIYDYLSKNTISSGHAKAQINQEIEKAKIIMANPTANKQIIHDTEDTEFCKGNIAFALYCIDYDIDNNPDVSDFDAEKLKPLCNIIKNDLNPDITITDEFKRAFLTIKNNDYYEIWGSWSHSFNCHKRWLLNRNSDLLQFANSKDWKRDYLKKLLVQRKEYDFSTICDNYNIPEGMPKWKEKLIKGEVLLKGATFILIPNDNSYCLLAKQQRPSRDDQVTKITNG